MLKGIVDIPVYPLKRLFIGSIPIVEPDGAPVSTILMKSYKIAITRFDKRVCVGNGEIVRALISHSVTTPRDAGDGCARSFSSAAVILSVTFWTGLRPMTPDGTRR